MKQKQLQIEQNKKIIALKSGNLAPLQMQLKQSSNTINMHRRQKEKDNAEIKGLKYVHLYYDQTDKNSFERSERKASKGSQVISVVVIWIECVCRLLREKDSKILALSSAAEACKYHINILKACIIYNNFS